MIAIGNGEACPFCKDKKEEDKFICTSENNTSKDGTPGDTWLEHLFTEHPKEAEKFLFSGDNIGL